MPFRRPQWVILATSLFSWTMGIHMVALPLIGKEIIHASPAKLGYYGSFPAIVYIFCALWSGRLSDRLGRQAVIGLALTVSIVGTTLVLFMQSPWWFLVPCVLIGTGQGMFWPALEGAMSDRQNARQTKRATGAFNLAWMLTLGVGSITGGMLYAVRPALAPLATIAMFAAIFVAMLLPGAMRIAPWGADANDFNHHERVAAPKRRLFVLLGLMANVAAYFFLGGFRSLLPEYASAVGITGLHYGLLTSMPNFGMFIANFVFLAWHGWHYSLRFLWGAMLAGAALQICFVLSDAYPLLLATAFLAGFPLGLTYWSSIYYGLEQSEGKGAHGGWHEAMVGLGISLGPLLGGWTISLTGAARSNLVLSAVVFAVIVLLQVILARRRLAPQRRAETV